MSVDLSHIPVVDNHCHGFYREQDRRDIAAWRGHFTEAGDSGARGEQVATTLYYRRLIPALAELLACEPEEAPVLAARGERGGRALIATLLREANVEALLIDQGYPAPHLVIPNAELTALTGCRVEPILRLETLMQDLIAQNETLEAVSEALRATLSDVRAQGYVGLKSIAAYRTGLAIREWEPAEAQAAFATARREVDATGTLRLAHKPLLDTLLHVAFAEAARQEVPVQFHTGYGDTDADLLLANPLHLRAVLEIRAHRGMPVVMLHEAYPYTREGGYLAAVYENVYLDLSYGTPFLGYGEMLASTRAALGVAPYARLLYSSDGVGVPEIHWLSARDGRRILGQALSECVAEGDLRAADAEAAGAAILRENAIRLYRL